MAFESTKACLLIGARIAALPRHPSDGSTIAV